MALHDMVQRVRGVEPMSRCVYPPETLSGKSMELQNATIGSDMAEAVLVRNTSNGPQVFLIYFLLGEDGVWRIDGM